MFIVATPQATPKHLTDEELRQQYGIQLASRPQDDGDGKEAKWADIDDDEDDWAPETIEWNDGTKINVSQTDHANTIPEERTGQDSTKEKDTEGEGPKPVVTAANPVTTTTIGPNATVLKLGSSAQPRSGGLVLKGPSEKPTLVAKISASNQVKSPWASLPPVDKVPPMPINPPSQPQSSRFTHRDPHGFDAIPPQPSHAKEIAADDFSRSSREVPNSNPKELFNSQSGRYEPVNETRRGSSVRKDQNFRAPAVLQRPSQSDYPGPAEPSAAFQTQRSSQEPTSWSRRRASSNLSGESGNFARRMSQDKGFDVRRMPGDAHQHRRDSQYDHSPLTPVIQSARFNRDVSPVQSRGQSVASQSPIVATSQQTVISDTPAVSPQQAHAQPTGVPNAPSTISEPAQDAVALQKKLMDEKRLAAAKRISDEQAKEVAEKKERIRLMLEKLGNAEDKMSKEASKDTKPAAPPTTKQRREVEPSAPSSPPKPPLPNASGTPQQYGMMKVHASQPVNGLPGNSEWTDNKPPEKAQVKPKIPAASDIRNPDPTPITHALPAKTSEETQDRDTHPPPVAEDPAQEPTIENKHQAWKSAQQGTNTYTNWNNTSMTTHSTPGGSLWGPPSNHKALGNGDFQQSIQRPQTRQLQYHGNTLSTQPQPIGPPKPSQPLRADPPPAKSLSDSKMRSIVEDAQTIPAFPSHESSSMASRTTTSQQFSGKPITAATPSPDSHIHHLPQSGHPQPTGLGAWASFSATVAKQDKQRNDKAMQEHMAQLADEKRTGVQPELHIPVMNETWRQVQRNDSGNQRRVVNSTTQTKSLPNQDQPTPADPQNILPKPANVGPVAPRAHSRYQDIFEQNQRAVSAPLNLSRTYSPSPPPPDSTDHPAFIGISQRPLVNLPGSKPKFVAPKPTVRLPPTTIVKQLLSPSEPRNSASRTVSQPQVTNTSWQARIDGLLGRESLPEKKVADTIEFSSSKVPLELTSINLSAAVTLPPLDEVVQLVGPYDRYLPTKSVEEEDALFEERDFGSVPLVHIPNMAPQAAWTPSEPPKHFRGRQGMLNDSHVLSVISNSTDGAIFGNINHVIIRVGNMTGPRTKALPRSYAQSTSRSPQSNSPKARAQSRHNHKPKDNAASYGPPKSTPNGAGRLASHQIPNHQSRPKIGTNNMSWARRASGIVS